MPVRVHQMKCYRIHYSVEMALCQGFAIILQNPGQGYGAAYGQAPGDKKKQWKYGIRLSYILIADGQGAERIEWEIYFDFILKLNKIIYILE